MNRVSWGQFLSINEPSSFAVDLAEFISMSQYRRFDIMHAVFRLPDFQLVKL